MRRGSRRAEAGNAFLEFALVILPLLAFVLAIFDFGFGIFLRSTFQHAVREGVRYAVTGRTEPGFGHDASIKSVVQRHALGFLKGEEGAALIQIRYYVPGSLVETPSNAGGNIVEISVEGYTWQWMAPLWRSALPALTIRARSSDRMEPSPPGGPPPR